MSVQENDNMQYNGWKSMLHRNLPLPSLGLTSILKKRTNLDPQANSPPTAQKLLGICMPTH